MTISLSEQTHHLQAMLTVLDMETAYWRLNGRLWLYTAAVLAQIASVRLAMAAINRQVRELPAMVEIDSEDVLADMLLHMQQTIRQGYQSLEQLSGHDLKWFQGLSISMSRAMQKSLHRQIGSLRQYILEHDADLSPDSGKSFTDAKELFNHLNGL